MGSTLLYTTEFSRIEPIRTYLEYNENEGCEKKKPKSLRQLKRRITEAWNGIDQEFMDFSILQAHRMRKMVAKRKGGLCSDKS